MIDDEYDHLPRWDRSIMGPLPPWQIPPEERQAWAVGAAGALGIAFVILAVCLAILAVAWALGLVAEPARDALPLFAGCAAAVRGIGVRRFMNGYDVLVVAVCGIFAVAVVVWIRAHWPDDGAR